MEILIALLMAATAVGAVLIPFLARNRAARAAPDAGLVLEEDDVIEAEIARYREALRAGTVCVHCTFANPAKSRFCADCGRRLAEPEAGEAAAAGVV